MTGAELLLIGLRLHLHSFDEDFRGEMSLIVPSAVGSLDDLMPLTESLIKQGHSHLRPWVACSRQLEDAESQKVDEIRDFMAQMYEKARNLGWTPDQDLTLWLREHGGFEPSQPSPDATPDGGWA